MGEEHLEAAQGSDTRNMIIVVGLVITIAVALYLFNSSIESEK
jgi:hypothetical protein